MLRILILAGFATVALAAPSLASADEVRGQQFRHSAEGAPVVADDGTNLGRVSHVQRDRNGCIVSASVEGLEPSDEPSSAPEMVASNDPNYFPIRYSREEAQRRGYVGDTQTRSR